MLLYNFDEKVTGSMTKSIYGGYEVYYSYGTPITIIANDGTVWHNIEKYSKTTTTHQNISLKGTAGHTRINVDCRYLENKIFELDQLVAKQLSGVLKLNIYTCFDLGTALQKVLGTRDIDIVQVSIDERDWEVTILAKMELSTYTSALRINNNILTYRNKNYSLEA